VHPNGKFLYAAKVTIIKPGGSLSAFAIDAASGKRRL
jgi:hypothetical protein